MTRRTRPKPWDQAPCTRLYTTLPITQLYIAVHAWSTSIHRNLVPRRRCTDRTHLQRAWNAAGPSLTLRGRGSPRFCDERTLQRQPHTHARMGTRRRESPPLGIVVARGHHLVGAPTNNPWHDPQSMPRLQRQRLEQSEATSTTRKDGEPSSHWLPVSGRRHSCAPPTRRRAAAAARARHNAHAPRAATPPPRAARAQPQVARLSVEAARSCRARGTESDGWHAHAATAMVAR